MANILLHGRMIEMFPIQGGVTKTIKVCLSADSGSVTVNLASRNGLVSFSSSSLNFTSGNWNVFQSVTVTAINATYFNGVFDYIDATGTGLTSASKKIIALYSDQGLFLRSFNWLSEITIDSLAEVTTQAAALLAYNFNGNGLPANATPYASASFTGYMHGGTGVGSQLNTSALVGAGTVMKTDWEWFDVDAQRWEHTVFMIPASVPASPRKLCFVHGGHTGAGEAMPINALLAEGIDVYYTCMPVTGAQHTVQAHNSTITSVESAGHNQFLTGGLDRVGYAPIEIYLFDKVMALNYAVALGIYGDRIYQIGISGGCASTIYLGAHCEQIKKSYHVRGVMPRCFIQAPNTLAGGGDYEGSGTALGVYTNNGVRRYNAYTAVPFFDILILNSSSGRRSCVVGHYNDTEGTGGISVPLYEAKINEVCQSITGGSFGYHLNNVFADSAHAYRQTEVDFIIGDILS